MQGALSFLQSRLEAIGVRTILERSRVQNASRLGVFLEEDASLSLMLSIERRKDGV